MTNDLAVFCIIQNDFYHFSAYIDMPSASKVCCECKKEAVSKTDTASYIRFYEADTILVVVKFQRSEGFASNEEVLCIYVVVEVAILF